MTVRRQESDGGAPQGGNELSASGDAAVPAAQQPDAGRGPEPIRVLIADDHALFRRGLEMVLDEEVPVVVVESLLVLLLVSVAVEEVVDDFLHDREAQASAAWLYGANERVK